MKCCTSQSLDGEQNFLVSVDKIQYCTVFKLLSSQAQEPTNFSVFILEDSYLVNTLVFAPSLYIKIAFSFQNGSETKLQNILHECIYTQKDIDLLAHSVPQIIKVVNLSSATM